MFRSGGNRFSRDAAAKSNKRDTGYLRSSTTLLFHEFQCKNAATVRFNASGKDAAAATRRRATNLVESPHNPQFCPVRRVKISSFGKQEAFRGLILTPLGMTPRVRGACSQVACCQWAARCPPREKIGATFFSSRGKNFLPILEIIFQLRVLHLRKGDTNCAGARSYSFYIVKRTSIIFFFLIEMENYN